MIYVVTAVHNRIKMTRRFVESLLAQDYVDGIHFILVDDGSTDGSDKMVKETYPNSTVLYGNGKLFWGGALHMAYKHLMALNLRDEDIIFYANDDSRFGPNFLSGLIKLIEKHPNDLAVGCAYGINSQNYLDGPIFFNLKNGAVKHLPAGHTGNCASTRALGMKAAVFKDIGGFHPILLPHYGSDYEYTIRAFKKGHKVVSDKVIRYTFSEDTTGDNSHKNITLKRIMNKRSKLNPFYKLMFILLIAPIYRLPSYISYQFKHFNHHDRDSGKAV